MKSKINNLIVLHNKFDRIITNLLYMLLKLKESLLTY